MLSPFITLFFSLLFFEVRKQLSDINNNDTDAEVGPEEDGDAATGDGPPAPKRAQVDVDFEDWDNVPVDNVIDEVELYSTRNHKMKDEKDVLGWWQENHHSYPKLAILARGILAIPASSSSSERNFSTAGRTIEERRTALNPSTVDAILFLHNNM